MLGLGGRRRDKPQMRQSPHLAGFVVFGLVGRGNLKQVGIYLFLLANNRSDKLLGIPDGMLRGLDFDGRYFLSSA